MLSTSRQHLFSPPLDVIQDAFSRTVAPASLVFRTKLRGSPLFTLNSFDKAPFTKDTLITRLNGRKDKVSSFLFGSCSDRVKLVLAKPHRTRADHQALAEDMNRVLSDPSSLFDEATAGFTPSIETLDILNHCSKCPLQKTTPCLTRMRRYILEDCYPQEIAPNYLRNTLEAFALAIRTYTPFSKNDVILVRAVTALIAAALDISESTTMVALHQLQHGLKKGTRKFLESVRDLTDPSQSVVTAVRTRQDPLQRLWLTALNISGPNDVILGEVTEQGTSPGRTPFGRFYEVELESRFQDYASCAGVWKMRFEPPEKPNDWASLAAIPVPYATGLFLGVCDILFCNAIEHSHGSFVRIRLLTEPGVALIVVEDDGEGIEPSREESLKDPSFASSRNWGFGLRAAKHALAQVGCDLRVVSNRKRNDSITSVAIVITLSPGGNPR